MLIAPRSGLRARRVAPFALRKLPAQPRMACWLAAAARRDAVQRLPAMAAFARRRVMRFDPPVEMPARPAGAAHLGSAAIDTRHSDRAVREADLRGTAREPLAYS